MHNASALDAPAAEVLSGARRTGAPIWVPRLFPRLPELRYTRRVHETLTRGFDALYGAGRGEARVVDAPLIHLGELAALRADLGRDDRNERLLRRVLDEDPSDGELAGYLAAQLLKAERRAEARAVGERSLALDGAPSSQQVLPGVTSDLARLRLGVMLAAMGDVHEAAALLARVGGAWAGEAQRIAMGLRAR